MGSGIGRHRAALARARASRSNRPYLLLFWAACLVIGVAGYIASAFLTPVTGQNAGARVVVLEATGIVSPPYAQYLVDGIEDNQTGTDLIVLEMDTPGGLVTSMEEIVRAILASRVPVATYVAPSGARALSAGTYIAYASHIAAMAPGTTIGAATPVQMGGSEPTPIPPPMEEPVETPSEEAAPSTENEAPAGEGEPDAPASPQPGSASELKAVNAYVSYIVGLAELRGRNAEWAEEAVREARSAYYSEALELGVIDYVASDLADLLAQAEGMVVETAAGEQILALGNAIVERDEPSLLVRVLMIISDPNIAFLLMNLGTIGLLVELYNPGSFFPGVVGVICLLLGLYSLSVLPTNYVGVALFFMGIAFIGLEFFVPSGGILGIGGLIAMGLGAFFLFDTEVPGLQVSRPLILGALAVTGGFLFLVASYAGAARARPVHTGIEGLIGAHGKVTRWEGDSGYILADGENWQARASEPLKVGQEVIIKAMEGIIAIVVPRKDKKK